MRENLVVLNRTLQRGEKFFASTIISLTIFSLQPRKKTLSFTLWIFVKVFGVKHFVIIFGSTFLLKPILENYFSLVIPAIN